MMQSCNIIKRRSLFGFIIPRTRARQTAFCRARGRHESSGTRQKLNHTLVGNGVDQVTVEFVREVGVNTFGTPTCCVLNCPRCFRSEKETKTHYPLQEMKMRAIQHKINRYAFTKRRYFMILYTPTPWGKQNLATKDDAVMLFSGRVLAHF